ncbi:MAG: transcription termination factor Rho [Patescibacteria group bacterium]|nr:MAG: transcription termination factor Rho [Patescibacteria group bacterium]
MPYRKSSISKSDHTQSQDLDVGSDEIKVKKEKESYKDQTENATSLSVEDFVGIPLRNERNLRKTSSKGSSEDDFRYDPLQQGSVGTSSEEGLEYKGYRNDGQYQQQIQSVPTEKVVGILDIQPEGHGFLRPKFVPSNRDIYISQSQIRRFSLRPGDQVEGIARPPKDNERYYGLLKVEKVNGKPPEESLNRPWFEDLTPIYPKKQIVLETGKVPLSTRIIDLIAPIGFGQRGMIVSPPKAGKTTILKEIAAGIAKNYPKVHLMAALIGERPEEVTDITMSVKGEVVASNFDEPPEHQTRVAEITLERAKRLVEEGRDVVVLLDSITRLARAYNLSVAPSGRTLTGGFDPAALWPAKRFFGAARNCAEGGSLTIIGTALIDTGSRLDDLVYEEFKGTGNMELHLDRRLAERRIFPAINIERSGTRQEELILPEKYYKKIVTMRRMMDMLSPEERTAILIDQLSKTETNEEFLENLGKEK